MHANSLRHMHALVERYLDPAQSLTIADIGSYDVSGSYRPLFANGPWSYTGIDVSAGPNVDVVLESPYQFPFGDAHFDVLVSGQAFEHVKFFWLTWLEMVRTLKPGGFIFLVAPSRGPEHRFPVDCWRFYPDGFRALAEYGSVECLEARTDWAAYPGARGRLWGDTVGVFAKAPYVISDAARRALDESRSSSTARSGLERTASNLAGLVDGTLRAVVRRLRLRRRPHG